jgi:hypothetical protein
MIMVTVSGWNLRFLAFPFMAILRSRFCGWRQANKLYLNLVSKRFSDL